MGQFSWLDCRTGEPIINGLDKKVYLLVPEEFDEDGTGHIEADYYDGYGHFGSKDVYDLVALWNREKATPSMLKGSLEERLVASGPNQDFDSYLSRIRALEQSVCRLERFKSTDPARWEQMTDLYGTHYLREIGISIAGSDAQNAKLPHPIKITYDPKARYEACQPSLRDPNQGFGD